MRLLLLALLQGGASVARFYPRMAPHGLGDFPRMGAVRRRPGARTPGQPAEPGAEVPGPDGGSDMASSR